VRIVALLLLVASAEAEAAPRVQRFHCEIGDGRTSLLVPRAREEASEDELQCRAVLTGLPADGTAALAAEVRLRLPGGRFRVVAGGTFERDGVRATLEDLIVPHATWAPAIVWEKDGYPRLTLALHVFSRRPSSRRWHPLLVRQLVIDHPRRQRSR
jgi:hypothetical protein